MSTSFHKLGPVRSYQNPRYDRPASNFRPIRFTLALVVGVMILSTLSALPQMMLRVVKTGIVDITLFIL